MDWDRLLPVSPESVPVYVSPERRLTKLPPSAHSALESLSTIADFLVPSSTNRPDFLQECASGAFDGTIAAYMTFPSVSITGPWDSELIAALPKSLLFCAHNGAGYNQVDVQACSAREPPIRVSNVPKLADDATADTAVFLILGALRNFNSSMFALRQHDPRGKVLGILGMGGIGRNLMRKCEVFGFRTVYHNRSKLSEEEAGGAEWVGFEELLAKADVLSLNLPLNVSLAGGGLFGFLGCCWLQHVAQMI
jgi:glyoxylate reductase